MYEKKVKLENLFRPGTGSEPPYFAGRLEELLFFNGQAEKLVERQQIVGDMVVYGPRGNGKTAMLRYLQKRTSDRLETLWVTPSEFQEISELIQLIIGNDSGFLKRVEKMLRPLLDNLSATANIGVAQVKTDLFRPLETNALKAVLQEKCQKKPLIMIIDEAHTLDPKISKVLFNTSQDIRGEKCPFFLVLAGTPDLRTVLRKASATFWNRGEIFPLGRLSSEEAKQALTIPLEQFEIMFTEDALYEVVCHTHGYPYFIQIWGNYIANRLAINASQKVTIDTIRDVEEKAMKKCKTIYQDRYDELQEMKLRTPAIRIGQALRETNRKYLPAIEIEELVGTALQEQGISPTHELVLENIRKLSHIGYIWEISVPSKAKGEEPLLCYEPGIPSLMNYVERQVLGDSEK